MYRLGTVSNKFLEGEGEWGSGLKLALRDPKTLALSFHSGKNIFVRSVWRSSYSSMNRYWQQITGKAFNEHYEVPRDIEFVRCENAYVRNVRTYGVCYVRTYVHLLSSLYRLHSLMDFHNFTQMLEMIISRASLTFRVLGLRSRSLWLV